MKKQLQLVEEAKRLLSKGEDCAHLFINMEREYQIRLKHFVYELPEDVAEKTIFGRVALSSREHIPRGRGRPRKI